MHRSRVCSLSGVRLVVALVLLCSLAAADGRREKLLRDIAAQVERAYASGDPVLVRSALGRVKAIRNRYGDKQLIPLARTVAAGIRNDDTAIAASAAMTLGEMRIKGSGKLLLDLLSVPARIDSNRLGVCLAVIEAIGAIHDEASLKPLEKLLLHPHTSIASGAAAALGNYWILDRRPRLKLVNRLIGTLEKLDIQVRTAEKEERRDHARAVFDSLLRGMNRIAERKDLNTIDVFKAWAKAERKRIQQS